MRIPIAAILLSTTAILSAQSDPIRDCRRQASVATGAALAEIDARVYQFMILWNTRSGGRSASGYCEANQQGQIVHFEQSLRESAAADPDRPAPDAVEACRREASISTGVEHETVETRLNMNLIFWQVKSGIRRIGGFCQADSRGRIVRFEAERGEIEDPISRDDAEVTCARAARRRLNAGDDEVEAKFQRAEGDSAFRIRWRFSGKTGWCVVDSASGRIRRMEAADGW